MPLAVAGVAVLLGVAGAAFWYQDWRYSLPTPRPAQLVERAPGERIALPESALVVIGKKSAGPIFLHFFNVDCPCSRFNVDHLAELYRKHGTAARFVAVVQATGTGAELADMRRRAERKLCGMTTILDPDGRIAAACGVYSTPQAVLLDADRRLLFRGNYNAARYCNTPATQFARIALEATLAGRAPAPMPSAATTAYGCELPAFVQLSRQP